MTLQKFIGDSGEVKVAGWLRDHDFQFICVFENERGNGLDVVAMKKYRVGDGLQRHVVSLEIKTTTSAGSPSLSANQKKAYLNTGTILLEACQGIKRFAGASPRVQKRARHLLAAVRSGVPLVPLAVTVNVDKASTHAAHPGGSVSAVTVDRVRVYRFTKESAPRKVKIYDSSLKGRWPRR